MINRLLIILLVVCGALNAGAQSIDAFPRTTTLTNTDLMLVQTNSAGAAGQKFTRSISASNFLESLKSFPNWTNAQPPNTTLTNLAGTGVTIFATNSFGNVLHTNAVSYALRLGLTNREAISDISGFFWTLQNNGLLSAFEDAAFLRGGQNSETNTARQTYKGGAGTAFNTPAQYAHGIDTSAGGYKFTVEDVSTNFTLIVSAQGNPTGQVASTHLIDYVKSDGWTNFGVGIGQQSGPLVPLVNSNAVSTYGNNYNQHLYTEQAFHNNPFPMTIGLGYQRAGLLTNWHNGQFSTNSSGHAPLAGLDTVVVGGRLYDAAPTHDGAWKGMVHGWFLFNRQLSAVEAKALEQAIRYLAPSERNAVFVGDSTTFFNYNKPTESYPYWFMIGPGSNSVQQYTYADTGRLLSSMISLWADGPRLRKPSGKVEGADAYIWGAINEIYTGSSAQLTFERNSNLWWLARSDGFKVHAATAMPGYSYDATMEAKRLAFNALVIANPEMYDVLYRRDLIFADTNEAGMFFDGFHLATNGNKRIAADIASGGNLGSARAMGVLSETNRLMFSNTNGVLFPVTNLSGLTFDGATATLTASGGGSLATNANQFGASVTLTIKDGALLTNTSISTALTLPTLTASRAAVLNSSGQLTNSAAVSDVELEYLDGVTSAIQTQLGSKQAGTFLLTNFSAMGITNIVSANGNTVITTNGGVLTLTAAAGGVGLTNANQFGASTTLTLADRLSVTNLNSYGTGAVFSGHVTVSSNITAQSFIGSGESTPYLLLSSPNGASFGLSVNTNLTVQTTNKLDFSSASAGQAMVLHSASAGQLVWTNEAASGGSVTFSAVPTALNSVSNYAKQRMFQSMKPNTSTSLDRQSAESPNTQGGAEVPPVNASLPVGLSATNFTGLYGWFPSTELFHYSTRDHVSTFLVSFVGQTSSNRTWIGLSGAAAIYNTDVPGTPTYGFRHSSVVADNNWVCYSADGTRTVSNLVTTGSITTNVLYALATVKTGTNVVFYIDGAPKFTNHFDPAGAIMSYRIIGSKAGATGARSGIILHDYFSTTTIP